jgi:hypothetical protein
MVVEYATEMDELAAADKLENPKCRSTQIVLL